MLSKGFYGQMNDTSSVSGTRISLLLFSIYRDIYIHKYIYLSVYLYLLNVSYCCIYVCSFGKVKCIVQVVNCYKEVVKKESRHSLNLFFSCANDRGDCDGGGTCACYIQTFRKGIPLRNLSRKRICNISVL